MLAVNTSGLLSLPGQACNESYDGGTSRCSACRATIIDNMEIIRAEGLVRKFGSFTAVNGVSFSVNEGEVFGFLGPNGAGKTTTINMLCTLLRPTAGGAAINGFDLHRQSSQVRQSIGLVFQDPSLDFNLTALENLQFHAFVYNVPRALREKRIQELLTMVELWDRRNDIVKYFSGGMKRRLEIARGLIHRPKVLFLDEPTLGLDPQTRNRIWEYISRVRSEDGLSIFLTTHYMDEAENAQRIAIIDHGKIIALDTPEKLKGQVGGDIITIRTDNDREAIAELKARFQIEARGDGSGIVFEVKDGGVFIPQLLGSIQTRVKNISLRRPTLDDVFLKLTGRELRDEMIDGQETMKDLWRAHLGMGKRR